MDKTLFPKDLCPGSIKDIIAYPTAEEATFMSLAQAAREFIYVGKNRVEDKVLFLDSKTLEYYMLSKAGLVTQTQNSIRTAWGFFQPAVVAFVLGQQKDIHLTNVCPECGVHHVFARWTPEGVKIKNEIQS